MSGPSDVPAGCWCTFWHLRNFLYWKTQANPSTHYKNWKLLWCFNSRWKRYNFWKTIKEVTKWDIYWIKLWFRQTISQHLLNTFWWSFELTSLPSTMLTTFRAHHAMTLASIFTAGKRSLGQGNIFFVKNWPSK